MRGRLIVSAAILGVMVGLGFFVPFVAHAAPVVDCSVDFSCLSDPDLAGAFVNDPDLGTLSLELSEKISSSLSSSIHTIQPIVVPSSRDLLPVGQTIRAELTVSLLPDASTVLAPPIPRHALLMFQIKGNQTSLGFAYVYAPKLTSGDPTNGLNLFAARFLVKNSTLAFLDGSGNVFVVQRVGQVAGDGPFTSDSTAVIAEVTIQQYSILQ